MISYWEKSELLHCDIAIVGGGIVGLSVAASLKERFPQRSIRILERSLLPYGASTRNAGFACFGSLTEVLSDIDRMGENAARELLFKRWMGMAITRKRLGDQAMGFAELGGYELLDSDDARSSKIDTVNALVSDFLPDYLTVKTPLKAALGLKSSGELISMAQEGQVNTGLMMRSLARYVAELGGEIITGAKVVEVNDGNNISILVEDALRGELEFTSLRLILCTNAFTRNLDPNYEILPARGQVLLTRPIPSLKFSGNLHLDEGFYYMRSLDNRLMIGGARQLAFEEEATLAIDLNPKLQQHLKETAEQLIGHSVEVDAQWAGIMGFTNDKLPLVEWKSDQTLIAAGMSGMGVALAGFIGEEVSDLMQGKEPHQ